MREIVTGPGLDRLPFFDPQRVRALVDELPRLDRMRRLVMDPVMIAVASLCVMQERFGL